MSTRPTTSIYLDTRRKKQNETYPVKLRITFQGDRKYYSLGHSLTEDEFAKVIQKSPRGGYRKTYLELDDERQRAEGIIKNIKPFTFADFEKEFLSPKKTDEDIYSLFDEYITRLEKEGRIGTRDSYKYSQQSLQKYHNGSKLPFHKINKNFLDGYEKYMIDTDRTKTTLGIYLRALRAIVNTAIARGLMTEYPFGREKDGKYEIKKSSSRKMALRTEQLKKLFSEHKPNANSAEQFFTDLWKFSFLCFGINVKDICLLKWKNVVGQSIEFEREKTKRSNTGISISIPLNDDIRTILDRWANDSSTKENYIFPILQQKMSEERIKAEVRQLTKQINKYIRKACMALEIEDYSQVTTYTARHSASTQLMRKGASVAFISKQLGHTNIQTTVAYLENFEDNQIREWQSKMTDFES